MDIRTPAECYVYRKRNIQSPALQRSAMCAETTSTLHNQTISYIKFTLKHRILIMKHEKDQAKWRKKNRAVSKHYLAW